MKVTDVVAGLTLIGLLLGIPGWVDADDALREQTVFTVKQIIASEIARMPEQATPYPPQWVHREREHFQFSRREWDRVKGKRRR